MRRGGRVWYGFSEGDVSAVSKAKILNKRDFAWVQRGTIQGLRLVTIFRVRLVANCREALCVPVVKFQKLAKDRSSLVRVFSISVLVTQKVGRPVALVPESAGRRGAYC